MSEGGVQGESNNPEKSLFHVDFPDESLFILPKEWEGVFVDYFGPNPNNYAIISDRLNLISGKYREHNAFPSKADGMAVKDKSMGRYDDPKYYVGDPVLDDPKYAKHLSKHTLAEIAKQILYIAIKPGLVQKTMQEVAEFRGERPPLVVSSKQILEEIISGEKPSQSGRLIMDPSSLLQHLGPYINWDKR